MNCNCAQKICLWRISSFLWALEILWVFVCCNQGEKKKKKKKEENEKKKKEKRLKTDEEAIDSDKCNLQRLDSSFIRASEASPNAQRLCKSIQHNGSNVVKTFQKMHPNSRGFVDFDSFAEVVSNPNAVRIERLSCGFI